MSTKPELPFEELPMDEKIERVLEDMSAYLRMHGGGITFVNFDEETGDVQVYMEGACIGCGIQSITLQRGILERLKAVIPEVVSITPVTI
ncbi:MAG: NifU family protein [Candidatus Heimdallarchaeota archaeon]